MSTLTQQFETTVGKYREFPAILFNEQTIEFGRLDEAVRRLAKGLTNLGIGKGDNVAVMLPNLPHFPISYFGALWVGATVVPLNIMLSQEDLRHVLQDCQAKAIIAWSGFKDTVLRASEGLDHLDKLIFLGERIPADSHSLTQLIADSPSGESAVECDEQDTAVIMYTAGTTGPPLGVELTHGNLVASASMCRDMFLLSSKDRLMAVLPLFHPFGQTAIMNAALQAGAPVVMHHRFRPHEVLASIGKSEVTFVAAVPSMLQAMLDAAQESDELSSLKYCVTFGSPLPEDIQNRFEEKFNALVLEGYGLTEATALVTCNRLDRERKPGSVGLPLVGIEVNVFGTDDQSLLPGETGEIVVKGPSVMKGYLNHPRETQQALRNGWLHTGDIGKVDADHYFYIVDRKKDVITKGGFHIYPHELEQVVIKHPKVAEVIAVGIPDPVQGEDVKLHVVLKKDEQATPEEIIEFTAEHLEVYKRPKYVEFNQSLPKSATGRILRRELKAQSPTQGSETATQNTSS